MSPEPRKTEGEKELQSRVILRQEPPACTCKPVNPRHPEAWYCVSKEMLTEWAKHETCYFTNPNDRKRACWMWVNFSQHPEARRLSGRVVTLEESDYLNWLANADARIEKRARDLDRAADHFGHSDADGTEWWQREM